MIFKTLLDGWYSFEGMQERLEDFMDKHWHWENITICPTGGIADNFEIVFEHHPTREWKT
jgi:hypothetical protein